MRVYRFMSKAELDLFLSKDLKDIGKTFLKGKLANNHRYKSTEKYVHVFRNVKDMDVVHQQRNFEYLVTFEIPLITLMISRGKGLYTYTKNGKIKQKYVKEYAINTKYFRPEFFIDYKQVPKYEPKLEDVKKIS